jgi:hypothetical protein
MDFFLDLNVEGRVDKLPRNVGDQMPSYCEAYDGRMKAVREFHGSLCDVYCDIMGTC